MSRRRLAIARASDMQSGANRCIQAEKQHSTPRKGPIGGADKASVARDAADRKDRTEVDREDHRSELILLRSMSLDDAERIRDAVEAPADCGGCVQREAPISPALYIAALGVLARARGLYTVDSQGVVDFPERAPSRQSGAVIANLEGDRR